MANANNIIIGAASVSVGGTDIGFTQGGTIWRHESTFIDVEADQAVGTVRKGRSLEKMFVVTNMLEVTLANLRMAMMQPAGNLSGSTLTLGYNNSCWTDELQIILTGPGPNCGTRTATFVRCVAMGNREYNMQRENATVLEVEFEVMKQNDGTFGTIVDG